MLHGKRDGPVCEGLARGVPKRIRDTRVDAQSLLIAKLVFILLTRAADVRTYTAV